MTRRARGLVIAAARSGTGKTTLTLGLLRSLRRSGVRVASAKSGPDFIDPGLHACATGRASVNLDGWAMRPALLDGLCRRLERTGAIVVVEGAMGLFDGREVCGAAGDGSTADIAARTGWPVVAVLDVSGQLQSVAAVARGLEAYRSDVRVGGVILNRVASPRHGRACRGALENAGVSVFGEVPRDPRLSLGRRHLGLVQVGDLERLDGQLHEMADVVEAHVDVAALMELACWSPGPLRSGSTRMRAPGRCIAVAKDDAFSFVYPHLMDGWRRAGAELRFFSPLQDEAPAASADVCWLAGGYPELYAGRLASSERFMNGVRRFAQGAAVHGECGGFMVLGQALTDLDGRVWPMLGLLGHHSSMARPRLHVGYRRARLARSGVLGARGSWCRGHEFHYSEREAAVPDAVLFDRVEGEGLLCAGAVRGRVSGSYLHFVDAAEDGAAQHLGSFAS